MRLLGQVAVITGAAGAFGTEIARRFAEEGADLMLADLNEKGLVDTARIVKAAGRTALTMHCDVTQRSDIERVVSATVEHFDQITVMVANAGVSQSVTFLDQNEEDWDRVLAVNLKGVFLCNQVAAFQMIQQGQGGQIVNMASMVSEVGSRVAVAYAASKAGVQNLTKSAALALAEYGIRVNAIGPGPIHTPLNTERYSKPAIREHQERRIPLQRLGDPVDVANVALFLASEETKWMTGETIYLDGGFLLNDVRDPEFNSAIQQLREQS